jgi:5-bromo-4-chloroindolyl phosphate hydrolysis protein
VHRDALARLEAGLSALGEQHGRLEEQERSTAELCKQLQDRNLQLTEAQQSLESDYQAMLAAERDQAMRIQSDQLLAHVESHQQALDHAEQVHRDALKRLEAELAALGERHRRPEEQERSTAELCQQLQDRNLKLTEAQKNLESDYQAMLAAERDHAMRIQSDQLLAQAESHQRALDHAEQVHRDALERLEADLAALGERHRVLEEQELSTAELCQQLQDRNLQLTEAQKNLESDYQAMLAAERTKQKELADEPLALRVSANRTARLGEHAIAAVLDSAEARSVLDAELKTVLAQVDDLKQRLDASDRFIREFAGVLEGLGIRYQLPA